MLPVAERFHEAGYRVSLAESLIMLQVEPDKDMEAFDVVYINVEFHRKYDPIVFPQLPAGYTYWSDIDLFGNERSGLVLHEVHPAEDAAMSRRELKWAVIALRRWADELMESGFPDVYAIAGLL